MAGPPTITMAASLSQRGIDLAGPWLQSNDPRQHLSIFLPQNSTSLKRPSVNLHFATRNPPAAIVKKYRLGAVFATGHLCKKC